MYRNVLLCHSTLYKIKDKKISMGEYNGRSFFECFNNTFLVDCGKTYLNLPPMTINDSPHTYKRAGYTSDTLTYAIYVTSGNSVITVTTPFDSQQFGPTRSKRGNLYQHDTCLGIRALHELDALIALERGGGGGGANRDASRRPWGIGVWWNQCVHHVIRVE